MRATCIMRFDRVPKGNDFVPSSKVGPQPDPKKWDWMEQMAMGPLLG